MTRQWPSSASRTGPHLTIDNPQLSGPNSRNQEADNQLTVSSRSQHLSAAINEYVSAAVSNNTRRAYQGDLADFLKWGGLVPCSPETLAAYIANRAQTLSPHTITRRIVGISRAHV